MPCGVWNEALAMPTGLRMIVTEGRGKVVPMASSLIDTLARS